MWEYQVQHTGVARFQYTVFANTIEIPLPPLPTQRRIAHILGSLDDKIELNRQMNETLEAMARAIFKSWFVDFNPVRAKGEGRQPAGMDAETAALFPDGFEEVDGREVPRGWRVEKIEDIAEKVGIPMTGAEYTTIQPLYREMSLTIPVGITIKSEVRPVLLNVQQENLIPGTQGYLTGEVKNVGHATGSEVVFSVVPFDNVTFQVVEGSTYIGRFEPGQTAPVWVRIAVKDHTEAGGYPAVLQGTYRESDGSTRTTPPVPVGITVAKGAVFRVDSPGIVISPGGTALIDVSYTNTGDSPATNAEARIIGSQVIVPANDSAVLGFLGPGETRTAQFEISAKSAISGKQYPLDTEVKYRDGLGALMLSDRASLGVSVQSPEGTDAVTGNPALMIAIAGVGVIVAYAGWSVWRKHKNQ